MRMIKTRFNSVCAETGAKLPKGVNAWYDSAERKVYALDSKKAEQVNERVDTDYINDALISNYNGGRPV